MVRLLGEELTRRSEGPSLVADAGEQACAQSLLGKVAQTRWLPTAAVAAYVGLSVPTLHTYRRGGPGRAAPRGGNHDRRRLEGVFTPGHPDTVTGTFDMGERYLAALTPSARDRKRTATFKVTALVGGRRGRL